jgi:hypothetical protein
VLSPPRSRTITKISMQLPDSDARAGEMHVLGQLGGSTTEDHGWGNCIGNR